MAQATRITRNTTKSEKKAGPASSYSFGRINYILMIIGVVIIAIGFVLMSGSEDIFSTMKMTVAPIVVVFGFGFEIYAIMKNPETPANQ